MDGAEKVENINLLTRLFLFLLLCRNPKEEAAVSYSREKLSQPRPQRTSWKRPRHCVPARILLERRPGRAGQIRSAGSAEWCGHEHQGGNSGRGLFRIGVSGPHYDHEAQCSPPCRRVQCGITAAAQCFAQLSASDFDLCRCPL